eukprot:TRINITY_DN3145_c0_g1_i2.p1 TRINITY_DN3145_c0_g1~~TRINITY_DN3145_c0_g1_i2.p1  ORF type:complete len:998 (+),score=245.46 TRINITY_DN3145_c0_g1_i2:282-3275(+)
MFFSPSESSASAEHPTVDQFTKNLVSTLVSGTKEANNFPGSTDYQYYASYTPFKTKMDELGRKIIGLAQNFIQHEKPTNSTLLLDDDDDLNDISNRFEQVVDVVDGIVERVDLYADEVTGLTSRKDFAIKYKENVQVQYSKNPAVSNIPKSQLKFEDPIDNNVPYIPKIRTKPNALTPLSDVFLHTTWNKKDQTWDPLTFDGNFPHPYEHELKSLNFGDIQQENVTVTPFKDITSTILHWVSTLDDLKSLAKILDSVEEFAVDLEAHNFRSYYGFVCLMQISTRETDYLVDTLALRSHMHILNSSFTNPRITKVLHGADFDVIWLQRDFGIYVVNMFDTGQASRVLDFPKFSLAFLLSHYCNIVVDKSYQLADWRVRELSPEMIKYAREDTHYLLYVYDCMRNDLLEKGKKNARANQSLDSRELLTQTWIRSRDVCLKKPNSDLVDESDALNFYNRNSLKLNPRQKKVFVDLYLLRDKVARDEDEGTSYLLPNQMLINLSMSLPTDLNNINACCLPNPPRITRTHYRAILEIVKNSKNLESALFQPIASMTNTTSNTPLTNNTNNNNNNNANNKNTVNPPSTPQNSQAPGQLSHTTTASPVLSTEQLYQTAGWLDKPGNTTQTSPLSQYTSHLIASPLPRKINIETKEGALFFDSNDMSDEEVEKTTKSGGHIMFNSDSDDSDDERAKQTAQLVRSSFSPASLAQSTSLSLHTIFGSSKQSQKEGKEKASSSSSSSSSSAESESESESESEDENVDQTEVKPPSPHKHRTSSSQEKVPQSMAEIYQLSNQNRKRNKEKKKLKVEGEILSTSPTFDVDEDDMNQDDTGNSDKSGKRQKSDETLGVANENNVEFMKEIGWLSPSHVQKQELHPSPMPAPKNEHNKTNSHHFPKHSNPDHKKHAARVPPRQHSAPNPNNPPNFHGKAPNASDNKNFAQPFDYNNASSPFSRHSSNNDNYFNPFSHRGSSHPKRGKPQGGGGGRGGGSFPNARGKPQPWSK